MFPLIVLIISFIGINTVSAHAYITNSNPSENEILEEAPEKVYIEFNEKIQTGFTILNVLNTSGERVDQKNIVINPDTEKSIEVDLKPELPNDIYTVEWRVVSADGHSVSGMIPFSIGELPEGASFPTQQENGNLTTFISMIINKGFLYIGFSLYMGLFLFYTIWFQKKNLSSTLIKRTKTVSMTAIILLAISIFTFLVIQTQSYAGGGIVASIKPTNLLETLSSTKEGTIWIIQIILLAILFVGQRSIWTKESYFERKHWFIPWLAFLGIMASKAFLGHPSSSPYETVAILFDFSHLLAASIWLGGMLVIVLFLREGVFAKEGEGHDMYWATMEKYSLWALFSVAVLAISGVINASLLIPDFHSLVSTAYGKTLLIKIGLLVFMLIFGAYHLVSRILLGKKDFYKKSIKIEIGLGILILLVTSAFTQIQTPTLPIDLPFYKEAELGGYNENISLSITPKKTGVQNQYEVFVFDNNRNPIDPVEQITITLKHGEKETSFPLTQEKEGHYFAENLQLNQPGKWDVEIHVLTDELESLDFSYPIQVR
ncbi:copper resistance CopC/CopD family protein [Niallia circulans]|uniref:Copper resistance protein CopC n=1 Tax=Niallia circulans TaxID=1397 RepID=A0A941GHC5_NIACI|nr:copper resistance CopC/CopD family protein [Niallia circulans]MCB5238299.1 copper resistance protein CopC [Niallia circulans]